MKKIIYFILILIYCIYIYTPVVYAQDLFDLSEEKAKGIKIDDSGGYFTASNVEDALQAMMDGTAKYDFIEITDASTRIWRDSNGNLEIEDAVSGAYSLAQLVLGGGSVNAAAISVSVVAFNGNLSASDSNVQTALETIDDLSLSGAPNNIDYLVGTASDDLSAERVVGTTPGGELGGTWASPTIDDSVTVTGWVLGTSSATQLTSPTLITDLIDTTGAADIDYGSADVTDHTFTSDGGTVILDGLVSASAGVDLGTSQALVGTTAITIGNNGQTVTINSSDWDIDATGIQTGMGNITSNGTIEGATLTEGGNAVYNSTETPGGELGGTWASPTIDDSIAVTNWNLTTPTITTSLTTSTPTTLTAAELDRLDGLTSAIIDDDKIDTFAELDTIVTDKALVNKADGAVWLGVHDFGGATSTEIVNGTDPTTDAAGEIAIDTNSPAAYGGIEIYAATGSALIPAIKTLHKTIIDPDGIQATEDAIPLMRVETEWAPHGITVLDIFLSADASNSGTYVIEEWTDPATWGSDIESCLFSASTEFEDDGTLSDSAVAAGSYIFIDFDTTALNFLNVTITYIINPGA